MGCAFPARIVIKPQPVLSWSDACGMRKIEWQPLCRELGRANRQTEVNMIDAAATANVYKHTR
jgi:hypothetical protein